MKLSQIIPNLHSTHNSDINGKLQLMNFFRRAFFNFWYYRQPPWDTSISPPELLAYIRRHPPGRALDIGCGTGTNVITLAQHGWHVIGVDFASKAIRSARKKNRHAEINVQFHVDDARYLRKVQPDFDFVLDIGCFHSLDDDGKARYAQRVDDLLKPGGDFLIYLFFKENAAAFSGAVEADLAHFASQWELISRANGSERNQRPSAWLHYSKPVV